MPSHRHRLAWEIAATALMGLALTAALLDWRQATAVAGTSISAATLALVRKP